MTALIHRVWTDDKKFALSRTADVVLIERAIVDADNIRRVVPVLAMSHRDFVDLFAGLCNGAASMPTHHFAMLRHAVAQLFEKGLG